MLRNINETIKVCKSNIKEFNLKNIKETIIGVKKLDADRKYKFLIMVLLVIILFAGLYIKSYVLDIIMIITMAIVYMYFKRKEDK